MLPRPLLLTLVLMPMAANADLGPQKNFLRDLAETRNYMLGRPVRPQPTPDGKAVLFLRSPPRSPEQSLYEFDCQSGQTRELLTPQKLLLGQAEHLSDAEKARRERMRQSARGFTTFELSEDGRQILLSLSGKLYSVERQSGTVAEVAPGETPIEDPRYSPDGKKVAYVRERDLYCFDLGTRKETRLTRSEHPRVSNGLAEFVAQEEMSRFSGFWWSPDSAALAFEEADNRPVETFHLFDLAHPEREARPTPYPRPGKPNALVRLGIVSLQGGSPVWVKWDALKLPYLVSVLWRDSAPLTLVVSDRLQRRVEVHKVDPRSGANTLLLTEEDEAWVNFDQSVPRWLPDGSAFVWSSEREGRERLEVRDSDGKLLRVLAAGAGYARLIQIDPQSRQIYFEANPDPTEMQVARVPFDGGNVQWLTRDPGEHTAVFGKDHQTWIETVVTLDAMPRSLVRRLDGHEAGGRVLGELPSLAEAPPFVPKMEMQSAGEEEFRVALVRPRGFDAQKSYPVVLDVYGGPHHLSVKKSMPTALLRQWIADHGYVVVALDGRGTPGRGRAWERAIRGNFGNIPLDDQVEGLQALGKRHPEMDLKRVGVFGWSFGGYMAALAVMRRPDVFQVGVAGAPVVDWQDYDTTYTERYLGLPEGNAEGYRQSSLLTFAPSLSRPLLIIHGTSDDNVYFLHTLKLSEALFRAGKTFELLPLSGLTHMVPDPVVKERLYDRILQTLSAALHP